MYIREIFHRCTENLYIKIFFDQTPAQKILKLALLIIIEAGLALLLYARRNWRAATFNPLPSNQASLKLSPSPLDSFKASELEYQSPSRIPVQSIPLPSKIEPTEEANKFFDDACDHNGDIRLWDTDTPRKIKKEDFLALSQQWITRGGKFFYPEEGKAAVVDRNTICSPWCHEGKNRSMLVFDYLMRQGHHETLFPEGAKDGFLSPTQPSVDDAKDERYRVLLETTGLKAKSVVRIGDKLQPDLQKGFTSIFDQFSSGNQPVMVFAFVSAVPILMREIMKRVKNKDLSNITLVAFHHDDPMAVPSPLKRAQAKKEDGWVVKNNLANTLERAQDLQEEWSKVSSKNSALRRSGKNEEDPERKELEQSCRNLAKQIEPLERELLFHCRKDSVERFQTEILAKLIFIQPS